MQAELDKESYEREQQSNRWYQLKH
jgi:hypothetical protein